MDYQQLIESMTPSIYNSLKRSLEIGKWPDGKPLTQEQRQETMHAIIAWGTLHLPDTEQVGYIDKGRKAGDSCDDPGESALKWRE